jgi:hypothetical protein
MAKAMTFAGGLVCGFMLATGVLATRADDVQAAVLEAAAAAHVDVQDLQGALSSQRARGLTEDPFEYLRSNGELPPVSLSGPSRPPPVAVSPPAPASGVSARVACIERAESGGANVANRRGSGAGGVMQYMPSTFARGAAEMGHPEWSLWNPAQARAVAAHDLALGRRAQWTVGGC